MTDMPVPDRRTKDQVEGELDFYASRRWPQLEEVAITWRGSYGYVHAYVTVTESIPLCRLRYLGLPDEWGFALYRASAEDYEDSILPTGSFTGTPQQALDCALGLYLNDLTAWQIGPLKNSRGAALDHGKSAQFVAGDTSVNGSPSAPEAQDPDPDNRLIIRREFNRHVPQSRTDPPVTNPQ